MAQAISALIPVITSGVIFSYRRANSGSDYAAANNPYVGLMNWNISFGQMSKALKQGASIAKTSSDSAAATISSAEEAIKALSNSDKIINGIGKVVNFTADHINPIICATGCVKVLSSDDKESAAIQEASALGTMFTFEKLYKEFAGMPKQEKINGITKTIKRDAAYKKNPFLDKQVSALVDLCETKKVFNKSLKYLPPFAKGLGFVAASVTGYKLGSYVGQQAAKSIIKNRNTNNLPLGMQNNDTKVTDQNCTIGIQNNNGSRTAA